MSDNDGNNNNNNNERTETRQVIGDALGCPNCRFPGAQLAGECTNCGWRDAAVHPKPEMLRGDESVAIVCPYCNMDPLAFRSVPIQSGPIRMFATFCANRHCRKLLALDIVGIESPIQQVSSPLMPPGGFGLKH